MPMPRISDAKERILDSALTLFYSRSYADVGVQELCEQAGVKKGSFYYFFKSKQELALAVLAHQLDKAKQSLWGPAFISELPPLDRIERLFHLTGTYQQSLKAQAGQTPGCLFGNLALEQGTLEEPIRKRIDQIFNGFIVSIEATLKEGVIRGDIPAIDTRATAEAILAYWEGALLLAKVRDQPELLPQLAQGARVLARAGLTTSQAPKEAT